MNSRDNFKDNSKNEFDQKKKPLNPSVDLKKLMEDFICRTIDGFESGIWKARKMADHIKKLKISELNMFILSFNIKYFNDAYKSLILKNDSYIMESFKKMTQLHDHSEICLLIIMFAHSMQIINNMDRSKIDSLNYQQYMEDIMKQTSKLSKINADMAHECHGEDISKCDPNVDLFYIK